MNRTRGCFLVLITLAFLVSPPPAADLKAPLEGVGFDCVDLPELAPVIIVQEPDPAPTWRPAVASWYGPGFHGKRAADGTVYDQAAFTAAHRTLPLGSVVLFAYGDRIAPALITDRGPYVPGREFDLSRGLACRLGFERRGVVELQVLVLDVGAPQ